jgi:hypothetical protein
MSSVKNLPGTFHCWSRFGVAVSIGLYHARYQVAPQIVAVNTDHVLDNSDVATLNMHKVRLVHVDSVLPGDVYVGPIPGR